VRVSLQRPYVRAALSLIVLATLTSVVYLWQDLRHSTYIDDFMPHGYCFAWNPHLVALHVTSDAVIGLSYFTISAILLAIVSRNRHLIPFGWMFVCFGGFIVACGLTHLMGIVVLWKPYYWLEGEIKLATAAISLATACLLPTLMPRIRKLLVDAESTAHAREQQEEAYTFTRSIIESSAFAILVTDSAGKITTMNPAAERLLWYASNEMVGKESIVRVFDPQEIEAIADARSLDLDRGMSGGFEVLTAKVRKGVADEGEWSMLRKDKTKIPVQVTVTSLDASANRTGFMFTAFDISERLRSQEYIRHIATHDPLTGLPSRILFRDRLEMALSRTRRFGAQVAVLMVDLDNFKKINDTLGHHAGDEALKITAQRLEESVRKTDTVARMGGDEFMILLNDIRPESVDEVASEILKNLSQPLMLGSHEVYITASIGVSIATPESDVVSLFKRTDIALYKSKSEGKNQIHHYSDDMAHATIERLQMETKLRQAVQTLNFKLLFQPQVLFESMEVVGFEALIRQPQPDGSVILPDQFIAIAEDTGLIVPIGEWVLMQSCVVAASLNRKLGRELIMAVNMSPRQFRDRGVVQAVRNALEESQLPARCLELEITEGLLLQSSTETRDAIDRLRALGVRLSIDDFGTGYSSMVYVSQFPIDRIKIDQSFVRKALSEKTSRAVIKGIVAMAHESGITVIGEGTETLDEARLLRSLKCDEVQGYLFSRPVEANQLDAITRAGYSRLELAN
jgi:diguanylate cyclase (GGDEF)-like protein/PAS domain S-box-containing protein